MNTNCAKLANRWGRLSRLVSASALCLLGLTALGQAGPKSPVGTWDCVMSGAREGLAMMTFFADGTFTNNEILVPKPASKPGPSNGDRNTSGTDPGRVPGIGNTNQTSLPAHTNIFGWETPQGQWGYDSRGRVIGFFYEITVPTYTTNMMSVGTTNVENVLYLTPTVIPAEVPDEFFVAQTVGTNESGLYINLTTPYLVVAQALTNQLSFVGTVVPGKRLSLTVSSPAGKITFSGVPDSLQPDFSGNWYGVERAGQLWYAEFMTFTRMDPSSNLYFVDGSGPAYTFSGLAMVFPQKKMALVASILPAFGADADPPLTIRSVVGPCNQRRFSGSLHGMQGLANGTTQRITYSLQHQ